jgi:two-component system alkaline phosphatase synthesis response regulator PhoP
MKQFIMIVEDNISISNLFRLKLESCGYDVEVVDNGENALEKLQFIAKEPDIILLDIMMPKMD